MRDDCQKHANTAMDPDCWGCKKYMEALERDLDRVNEQAQGVGAELARAGVDLPRDMLQNIRLETFIDMVFGNDERGRMVFEVECGRRVVIALSEGLHNVKAREDGIVTPPEPKLHVVKNSN